jgi:hypothetical protein
MQYLVISRGQWNPDLSREHLHDASDRPGTDAPT